jgi:hypothetical protein
MEKRVETGGSREKAETGLEKEGKRLRTEEETG